MKEKVTLVLFSGDLDKVLACFNIATAAAGMGMEVTIFFTFFGLNVITKPGPRFKGGIIKTMLSFVNRSGTKPRKLSKLNMGGVGTFLMKKLMKAANMPTLDELLKMAKEMGVKFVACSTTLGVMGIEKKDLIPEVDEVAGAATFVSEAKESKISLFI
jgi:peroxiredoxin family protein